MAEKKRKKTAGEILGEAMEKHCKENGIPCEIISVKIDPVVEKAVKDYCMEIEKAHRQAGKSKLRFRCTVIVT